MDCVRAKIIQFAWNSGENNVRFSSTRYDLKFD